MRHSIKHSTFKPANWFSRCCFSVVVVVVILIWKKIKRIKCRICVSKHSVDIFVFVYNANSRPTITRSHSTRKIHVIQFVKVKFIQFAYRAESVLVSICRVFACVSGIFCFALPFLHLFPFFILFISIVDIWIVYSHR